MPKFCKRAGKGIKKRFTSTIFQTERSEAMRWIRNSNAGLDKLAHGQYAASHSGRKVDLSALSCYYKKVWDGAKSITVSYRRKFSPSTVYDVGLYLD